MNLLFPVEPRRKDKVLELDFANNRSVDKSDHHTPITTTNAPPVTGGFASFSGRQKHHLRAELGQRAELTGCTEMTLGVKVRLEEGRRRHRFARILQTCDNQWGGTCLMVKDNRVHAWIETTAFKGTVVGDRLRWGRSPDLKSKRRMDDGKWHDILLCYDGERVELRIDGDLQDRTEWNGYLVNFDNINIGYVKSNGFHFDGDLDDIRIRGTDVLRTKRGR